MKIGDEIVYLSKCKTNKVYQVISIDDNGGLILNNGMRPWDFQVRLATPKEIEQGFRDE